MSNLNKAMLIGRLGQDPENRVTKSGSQVVSFTMATNNYWKDKQGNRQEQTDWHNIVVWGWLAEFSANYLRKGKLVYVEGRLQTRDWVDQQNVKHFKTEIVATTIQLLERQQGDGQQGDGQQGGGDRQGQGGYGAYPPSDPGPAQDSGQAPAPEGEQPYLEDDIPF